MPDFDCCSKLSTPEAASVGGTVVKLCLGYQSRRYDVYALHRKNSSIFGNRRQAVAKHVHRQPANTEVCVVLAMVSNS